MGSSSDSSSKLLGYVINLVTDPSPIETVISIYVVGIVVLYATDNASLESIAGITFFALLYLLYVAYFGRE